MTALETFRVGAFVVELHHDSDPESPRDWDNFGKIWTFDRRYNSPDETPARDPRAALECLAADLFPDANLDDMTDSDLLELVRRRAVVLPVFKYEHGGVAYSTGAFSCPWDSGQVGWTFATRAEILANWSGKRLTAALRKKAADLLTAGVKTYSQWANGEVYGYVIHTAEDPEDDDSLDHDGDHADSCWGFYGFEEVRAEGRSSAEYMEAERLKTAAMEALAARHDRQARLKTFIRNRVPLQVRAATL